jgi:thiamine biosynthesis protein ThiS
LNNPAAGQQKTDNQKPETNNMNIILNGETKEIAANLAVAGLIAELGLTPERLAIEVNRRIIRRADWPSTTLAEGDKVEIVHFVGGGAR